MTDKSPSFQGRSSEFLFLALWFGIVTGIGEVAILAYKKFYQERPVNFGLEVAWMAPVADACIFAILGIFLLLFSWRWPKLVSLFRAVFLFAFLGVLSMLFMFRSLAQYAALILAAGLAIRAATLIRSRSWGFGRIVRRTTPWLVVAVMSLGIGIYGYQRIHERFVLAGLPPSDPKAPNILLIVMDTVRAENLSLYGYGRPTTPNLERLGKGGVVFDRAISTAPWTLPSHAGMFTGRFPHELSTDWHRPLGNRYPTLAEILSSRGYLTAGFVANLWFCGSEFGLSRGFLHYEDYPVSIGEIFRSSSLARKMRSKVIGLHEIFGRKSAAEINESFLEWTDHARGRPFFAFLNYFDAHNPYLPPEPFLTRFAPEAASIDPTIIERWATGVNISETQAMAAQRAYDGAIAYIDHEIGRLINGLDKRGLLKNTLLIITSDHGEQFGRHGLFTHGVSLYRGALNVPLLLSLPAKIPLGKRVQDVVSLRDLPATIVDLVQLNGHVPFPGNSLARYWQIGPVSGDGEAPVLTETNRHVLPRQVPSSAGNMASLITKEWHYVVNGDGTEELYDFEHDALEQRNLARSSKDKVATFRALLMKTVEKKWLRQNNLP